MKIDKSPVISIETDGTIQWFKTKLECADYWNVDSMTIIRCLRSGRSINQYGVTVDYATTDKDMNEPSLLKHYYDNYNKYQ